MKFENAIKSERTREGYVYNLNRFLQWSKIKESDGLVQLKDSYLQEIVEDYVIYLKGKLSPNSIRTTLAPLELFFAMNDKNLNWKKIKKMYPARVKKSGEDPYTTEDVQIMLNLAKTLRARAIIHFLASTGCRVGVFDDLKMKHLSDMPDGCIMVKFYQGSIEEYYGFLIPEANKALQQYLDKRRQDGEVFSPESPVFRERYRVGGYNIRVMKSRNIKELVWGLLKRCSTTRVRIGMRYNIQLEHGFRKRFNTILKANDTVNLSLAEKLMGHQGVFQLDGTYFKPSVEQLFFEFRKHITNLTVDDSERLRLQVQLKDETIKKKESEKDLLIKDYGTRLSNSEKIIKRLSKRLDSLES